MRDHSLWTPATTPMLRSSPQLHRSPEIELCEDTCRVDSLAGKSGIPGWGTGRGSRRQCFFWVPIEFYDYLLPGRFESSPRILAKKIPRKIFGSSSASNGYLTPRVLELTSKIYCQANISIFCFSSDWFRHSRVVFRSREQTLLSFAKRNKRDLCVQTPKSGVRRGRSGRPGDFQREP